MKLVVLPVLVLLLTGSAALSAADDAGVTWLIDYDAKSAPAAPWTLVGQATAEVEAAGLRLKDGTDAVGHYRIEWEPRTADEEVIVEAVVKVVAVTGGSRFPTRGSPWPWRDGAGVSVLVSNGRHQEGLVLFSDQAASHTDRFIPMTTTDRFHTYRLVIRGNDMEMWVDGERKVTGQGAFWKPTESSRPFLQFGSSSKVGTGEAVWSALKLGVRTPTQPQATDPVRITVGPAWDLVRTDVRQTRPYLYDMGQGLLLKSVAQGPDAFYEPYGLLRSTDTGKTWTPIDGLDQQEFTPLPCLRRPDGSILAISRWTRTQPDGRVVGKTVTLNPEATRFTMADNQIVLPQQYTNEAPNDQVICERHIWNDADGGVTMMLWSRKAVTQPDGRRRVERWSHLMRSTDEGLTWNHFSTVGPGGEPAVVRLSDTAQTAVIRGERNSLMLQTFSSDGGRTWTDPRELEVGKVLPDLVLMSNGILACSYGRPASCLMFSLDGGQTWPSHHVISDKVNFNYTSIREISPGRLLYIHDAPRMSALLIDVERVSP